LRGGNEGKGEVTIMKIFILTLILCIASSPSFAEEGSFEKEDIVLPDNRIFLDRNGEILRFIPDEKGQRHIWIPVKEIPDIVKKAFIAAEDKRFYTHNGYDLLAIFRALKDNIFHGKIVSGASTITQQVVRLIYPHNRTYRDKLIEISRSSSLEGILSKDEILEQYLNRVPMGNNIIGIELASRVYFGKSAPELAVAEAALLAALPKAPGLLNPYGKGKEAILKRKDWVLSKMAEEGYLKKEELKDAMDYKIIFNKKNPFPNMSPHLVDLLIERDKNSHGIRQTTIDINLQKAVEEILISHKSRLASRGVSQAAAIVVHNPTMEVLASVGSFSYSVENGGYNNGTIAFRSPGSTIKPLLYAQAIEQGYTVSTLLEDTLRKYWTPNGNYSPDNFDRKEYGPVTLRVALGNSLNISAIKMVETIGIESIYKLLQRVNLVNNKRNEVEHYGLGLVIGNAEVSLEQLVTVYAMFASKGVYRPLKYILDRSNNHEDIIFSEDTAYIISDILSDPSARVITFGGVRDMNFPFRVSLKTGTSTRYRDGWAIGYTPEYTVGIWVGNFDGSPTGMVTGAGGAVPIFKDIIYLLHENSFPSTYTRPDDVVESYVCGISGMKPVPRCNYVTKELFIKGTEPVEVCTFHTNERYFHELPSNYAGWIYEKNKKVSAGSFRLKGFSRNLNDVFDKESSSDSLLNELPGIKIKISGQQEKKLDSIRSTAQGTNHYSVGAGIKNEYGANGYAGNQISITYPLPNDRFIIDKTKDAQIIRLETVSYMPVKYIDWFIDGRHYARTVPPYYVYWSLEKGKHSITAVAPNKIGDSIEIKVE
jgi:penicillin-binding protein 1C